MLPFVCCLCPTYGRPHLAANAAACFLAQDYPEDRRRLLVLDDAGQLLDHRDGSIVVMSHDTRFCAITRKYNALARRAVWIDQAEVLCVWEDDEIYLPGHIRTHVDALQRSGKLWSKPSRVLSDYPGRIVEENSAGRFHASIAVTREALDRVDGWPDTRRADFDQIFMGRLKHHCGDPADPLAYSVRPTYCFRWHSGSWHGQGYMDCPDDTDWWDRIPRPEVKARVELMPQMDDATERAYRSLSPMADCLPSPRE